MADWLQLKPRVHPEAGVQRVGDRVLAASPDDYLHTFEDAAGEASSVAERIVELSDGNRTIEQIVDALCEEFDVSREVCSTDAVEFVQLLVERKVLVVG